MSSDNQWHKLNSKIHLYHTSLSTLRAKLVSILLFANVTPQGLLIDKTTARDLISALIISLANFKQVQKEANASTILTNDLMDSLLKLNHKLVEVPHDKPD